MTRSLNIVLPMAGRGQRFVDAGYDKPKPLIAVRDRPMYAWATESLPLERAARLVFVCLAEHTVELAADIALRYGEHEPIVHPLAEVTAGQLATVLAARDHLEPNLPLVIYNADTVCRGALAETDEGPSVDGRIGVFRAEGSHWSFARTDATGRVVETAEKRRISEWATTGLYYFGKTSTFLSYADEMIAADDRTRGEFFVAPLYNRMIAAGCDIRIDLAEEVWPLGTPAELQRFLEVEEAPS